MLRIPTTYKNKIYEINLTKVTIFSSFIQQVFKSLNTSV